MSYSDPKYGLRRRIMMPMEDDVGTTGQSVGMLSFKNKTKIYKFGIIPNDADCIFATTSAFTLETDAGTDLGTWTPGHGTVGTGTATGKSITATTVAAGKVIRVNITTAGSSGSVNYFVDVKEQFDATVDDALT